MTEWLEDVYFLAEKRWADLAIDGAIDIIFDNIDELCFKCHESKDWNEIDDILNEVDLSRINTTLALSFLTITACVRKKLKNRESFYNKVKEKILAEGEEADKLLEGL